ncbi:hypothetical protein GQ42DRAFT_159884 [Ramicandelaber brevisporus]|nr:hypothetical protein GQ42DRAFT_159884 [Ramicandelaber brevisporus]
MAVYKYQVAMSCGGCSGAVERALKKLEGVDNLEVSLESQLVTVESDSLDYATILEKLQKTGKAVTEIPQE